MLKVVGASWSQIRLSTFIIGIVMVLGIIAIIVTETGQENEDGNYSATVYWSEELGYTIDFWRQGNLMDQIPKGVARAHYDPHIQETGWAVFQVETQPEFNDHVQAFAAGLVEGALTWQMIYWHWQNTVDSYCEEQLQLCSDIRRFLKTNLEWVRENANQRKDDPYWYQVYLYYVQLEAMEIGFKQGVKRSRQEIPDIPTTDFIWMNIFSDLPDLVEKFSGNMRKINASANFAPTYDCGFKEIPLASAFIKFLPEKERLFIGHNSAGPYSTMLKMFKRYEFRYHTSDAKGAPLVPGIKLSFSSYPAAIHSMDDFYIIGGEDGHNLVVSATPLTVFNTDLWDLVSPKHQVLLGPRATAANRLATESEAWTKIFSPYNSGTGNKAWLIVNMGLFDKAAAQRQNPKRFTAESLKNLFWVLEQIPGFISADEQTEKLIDKSYWASYGIPFYQTIFYKSGTEKMELEHGSTFSYEKTALANIFRRDQENVSSLQTTLKLMRSNLYKIDPFSEGNPRCAVGSRGDVKGLEGAPEPVGVTDIKVFRSNPPPGSFIPVRNRTVRVHLNLARLLITAGPAFSDKSTPEEPDDDMQPFSWSNGDFPDVSHIGQPDTWMFQPLPIHFA